VAYLKLSAVQAAQAASYVERSKSTTGLIIDLRNYPSEFVPFALGSLLVDQPTPFARFTAGDLDNPGAFLWRGAPLMLTPQQPHYSGKVVVLVDEVTLSQAEYTTMAFRASPRTVVVGSTTAEPTAMCRRSCFRRTANDDQRHRGLLPGQASDTADRDRSRHRVRPTIAGIRAGRDEVLEAALRQILGIRRARRSDREDGQACAVRMR
jgi:hypothetical protein